MNLGLLYTDSSKFYYVINSDYKNHPELFSNNFTEYGGASATSVAEGISLTVPAADFTAGIYPFPIGWGTPSVLPNYTYKATAIKSAFGNGIILCTEAASTTIPYWARLYAEYDFDTGIVTIKLQNTVFPPAYTLATSAAITINTNDEVECTFSYDYATITCTIKNLNTNESQVISSGFSAPTYAPTIYFLSVVLPLNTNAVVLNKYSFYVDAYVYPEFAAVGDSITQGYAGVSRNDLWVEKVRQSLPAYRTLQVDAMGSMRTEDALLWAGDITTRIKPQKVFLFIGANDSVTPTATFYANYETLVSVYKNAGFQVIHIGLVPLNSFDVSTRNSYLKTTYEGQGDIYVDIYPLLKDSVNPGYNPIYTVDGIHPSAAGNVIIANAVLAVI